ncbi:hypothetical protein QQ045_027400 [Rhodiola kirilowii]
MLLSEAEDAAGVWASHPSLKIRVTRVRRPWWLGGIGAGILLSAVGCDVDVGICLMVWLSAKFWVFKNDDLGEDAYVGLRVVTCLTVLALIIFAAS